MSVDELDKLKSLNQDRIAKIEERFFKRKEEIQNVKELLQARADARDPKEKHIDSSFNYPTYGRGVDPDPNMDTYMINRGLC